MSASSPTADPRSLLDPPTIDPWFTDASGNVVPERLAELIDVTARHCEERGRTVIAAAPLNEPDYDTKQGTIQTFYDVAGLLQQNPRFSTIRLKLLALEIHKFCVLTTYCAMVEILNLWYIVQANM